MPKGRKIAILFLTYFGECDQADTSRETRLLSSPFMTQLVDSYLLFRIRTKRDPEAFARIYDRYVEAIYRYALLKLPGTEEAQDATAETFTKAWQYLSENRQVTHVRALLYQIARSVIADFYRKHDQAFLYDPVTFQADPASSEISERTDPKQGQAYAEARADLALVLERLGRLKEDYQDVLTLRLIDDLPFSVIADILGKKTGHVRVMYHRALKALNDLNE